MRAYTILRVSSEEQKRKYGFDIQWEYEITPGAKALGLEVSESLCSRIDESATKEDRPDFVYAVNKAISLFEKGEIEALLFPRVDRESRDPFISIPLLLECFNSGLPIYFAREELYLDSKDLEAKQKYTDELSRSLSYIVTLRRNTMWGRKIRISKGKLANGKASHLYGYTYIPGKGEGEGIRQVNPETAKVVKDIFAWYCGEFIALNAVANRLGDLGISSPTGKGGWPRATVYKLLTNSDYCGGLATPPIIDQDTFDKAQVRLKGNRELSARNVKRNYLLRGYVYCYYCNRRYQGALKRYETEQGIKEYEYYRCSSSFKINASPCPNRSWKADELEAIVWQEVESALQNPKAITAGIEALEQEADKADSHLDTLTTINKRLEDLDRQQSKLLDDDLREYPEKMRQDKNAKINAERKGLKERKAEVKARIEQARQARVGSESIEQALTMIKANLGNLTFEDKRLALEALSIRVNISKDRIDIEGLLPISDGVLSSPRQDRVNQRTPQAIPFSIPVTIK